LNAKRFELVHELVPTAAIIAFLVHSTTTEAGISAAQDATRMLGVQLLVLNATSPSEIERAFATLVRERAGALVMGGDAFFGTQRDQIIALAARHAVPTMYQFREFPASGGLVSYGGGNVSDDYRQVGVYTGRILKGEKPADLPVQQATKVELVINLKTAKAVGLTIPQSLLFRADRLIE
jgi:putative tryptophan/tyrosine transport system substrate-binding protein